MFYLILISYTVFIRRLRRTCLWMKIKFRIKIYDRNYYSFTRSTKLLPNYLEICSILSFIIIVQTQNTYIHTHTRTHTRVIEDVVKILDWERKKFIIFIILNGILFSLPNICKNMFSRTNMINLYKHVMLYGVYSWWNIFCRVIGM